MSPRRYVVQDRWCEICSKPAALLVYTVGQPGLKPVCSTPHAELLIEQLTRQDENPTKMTEPQLDDLIQKVNE